MKSDSLDQLTTSVLDTTKEALIKLAETGDKLVDIASFGFLSYFYKEYLAPDAPWPMAMGHSSILYLALKSPSPYASTLALAYLGFKASSISSGIVDGIKPLVEVIEDHLKDADLPGKKVDPEGPTCVFQLLKDGVWETRDRGPCERLRRIYPISSPNYMRIVEVIKGGPPPDPDDENGDNGDNGDPVIDKGPICVYQKWMSQAQRWITLDKGKCDRMHKQYGSGMFGIQTGYRIVPLVASQG